MTGSLREKQKQFTRTLILDATADEIVEHGLGQLSLQTVAQRAGVSNKTLYNHFENREALLAELDRWVDGLIAEAGVNATSPTDLHDLPDMLAPLWQTWDALGNRFLAMLQVWATEGIHRIEHFAESDRQHADRLIHAVKTIQPSLTPAQTLAVTGTIRALANPGVWHRMTTIYGAPLEDGARSVSWAIRVVCNALVNGDHPFTNDDASAT